MNATQVVAQRKENISSLAGAIWAVSCIAAVIWGAITFGGTVMNELYQAAGSIFVGMT